MLVLQNSLFQIAEYYLIFYHMVQAISHLNFLYHKGNEYIAAEYVGRGFLLLLT